MTIVANPAEKIVNNAKTNQYVVLAMTTIFQMTQLINAKSAMIHAKHAMEQQWLTAMNAQKAIIKVMATAEPAITNVKHAKAPETFAHHAKRANTLTIKSTCAQIAIHLVKHAKIQTIALLAMKTITEKFQKENVCLAMTDQIVTHAFIIAPEILFTVQPVNSDIILHQYQVFQELIHV